MISERVIYLLLCKPKFAIGRAMSGDAGLGRSAIAKATKSTEMLSSGIVRPTNGIDGVGKVGK